VIHTAWTTFGNVRSVSYLRGRSRGRDRENMRWIVRPDDGRTVGEVLARAGADAAAVGDGRVFLGRRRVRGGDEPVRAGDVLSVTTPGAAEKGTARILVHAGDLVAADKPAGIPTIPDHAGSAHALLATVARALGMEAAGLHPTSRLDREVSGVVVFALTKAAAQRLLRARAERTYERRYLALAARAPEGERGTWDAPIGRAPDPRLRSVHGRDAAEASTRYAITARAPAGAALLAVAPQTGRTHQIRVHASHAGAPLLGDRAYGGPSRLTLPSGRVIEPGRIALHAARIVVPGEDGAPLVVTSPVPPELTSLWSALGGDPAAWEVSARCALS
jgi:23S rRNA pseudouridine1911/1915/1917 synthase